jgi:hypothetical protein
MVAGRRLLKPATVQDDQRYRIQRPHDRRTRGEIRISSGAMGDKIATARPTRLKLF